MALVRELPVRTSCPQQIQRVVENHCPAQDRRGPAPASRCQEHFATLRRRHDLIRAAGGGEQPDLADQEEKTWRHAV